MTDKIDYYQRAEISNSDLTWVEQQVYGSKFKAKNLEAIFAFGSLFHQLVLEPDKPFVSPIPIDEDKAKRMCDSLLKAKIAGYYMHEIVRSEGFRPEWEFYRTLEGVKCRGKLDGWYKGIKLIYELKSTSATTQAGFIEAINGFSIDKQNAFYLDLAKAEICLTVGVSKVNYKVFPYLVLKEDSTYKRGKEKYQNLMWHYKAIFKTLLDN